MARKHYRAAKKQVEHKHEKGVFIPDKYKTKLIFAGVGLVILIFLKGLLVGYISGRHD